MGFCRSTIPLYLRLRRVGGGRRGSYLDRRHRGAGERGGLGQGTGWRVFPRLAPVVWSLLGVGVLGLDHFELIFW